MYQIVRNVMFAAAAFSLAACSASQSGLAPSGPAAVPAAKAPAQGHKGHRHYRGPRVVDPIGGGTKMLNVNLSDASLPNGSGIQAVNIGIDQIMVTDTQGNVTTVAQYSTPKVVNVMAYQDGAATPIGSGDVSQMTYASLTLVVDTASSGIVTANAATRALSFLNEGTNSSSGFGAQTKTAPYGAGAVAITFSYPFKTQGSSVNLDVDVNVMESLLPGRSPQLRPSLSVAQSGIEGGAQGTLVNSSGAPVTNAVVVAVASDGTIAATTFTDSNGEFLLHTLNAGQYTLTIYNQYVSAAGWIINATNPTSSAMMPGGTVHVVQGQSAQVGTIAD
ncbi:MAG TPA: carboxypeptidase regulatory-like domain-containing protein [Candidatus Acidoferrales bacterium]|jgi:hypothetical protein|nr:carboxypeptidase regulatory-like domain-containing protein [Candidatus Acidoferrales bacterium]